MRRRHVLFLLILGFAAFDIWGLLVVFLLPAPVASQTLSATPLIVTSIPPPTPTFTPVVVQPSQPMPTFTPVVVQPAPPTPTSSFKATPMPDVPLNLRTSIVPLGQPLPSLYVDGPYLKRSDTHQPVWLKGVNVEEFRQAAPHTFTDLYFTQGLEMVTAQKWGINLLRIAVDPAMAQTTAPEIDKLISFAQANGMYVILAPFASAVDPSRSEQHMVIPDDLVASGMAYLAGRFKNRTNVLYGIWNEPHPDSIPSAGYEEQWQIWMPAGIKVAQAIRNSDPQAILVVPGGTKWARDLTYYKDHPFPFTSVIYDVHDYDAGPDYHYSRDMWTWAIGKYPIIIGEFGGNPIDPLDPRSIAYMNETIQIVNQHPGLIHYAMYVLSDDGAWGLFTRGLQRMPRGILLLDDLSRHAPTRLR